MGKPIQTSKPNRNLLPIILAAFLPVYVYIFSYLFLSKNGMTDVLAFYVWWLTFFLFGIAALPLTSFIFSDFRARGYGFSKTLGILLSSLLIWTLAYLKILPFTRLFVLISLLLLAAVSWSVPRLRKEAVLNLSQPDNMFQMIGSEALFASVLLILCYIKGIFPEINGEEKFMDFAFMNSILRTDSLPAPDPWYAGEGINYYYYGQYIYGFIAKLNNITPGIAYTLSMCTSIALPFSMACTLGTMIFEGAVRKGLRAPAIFRYGAGILSGLAVCIMGNSHSFFYDEKSFGNRFLPFFAKLGAQVGETDNFFYPNSTRYIGHNPDVRLFGENGELIRSGDYTIHEFPFYSYLIGDLHAHVVSMMIVLLIIAVLFVFVFRGTQSRESGLTARTLTQSDAKPERMNNILYELKRLLVPEMILVAVLLGLCTMCNYWDFLIYFVFASMALLVFNTLFSKNFVIVRAEGSSVRIDRTFAGLALFVVQIGAVLGVYLKLSSIPLTHAAVQIMVFFACAIIATLIPTALTRTGMGMSFLFSSAMIVSLPFQLNFQMISNAIALVDQRTAPYQFFIVWFVHILFSVVLIVLVIIGARGKEPGKRKSRKLSKAPVSELYPGNKVARFFGTRNRVDIFMCGTAVVGILMLLAPELIYVRDIYQGDYNRTNTMFKFAFAAFIQLSVVIGYTLFRVMSHRRKEGYRSVLCILLSIGLVLLLFVPAHYTKLSLLQRSGEISKERYEGLDGTLKLRIRNSPQLNSSYEGNLLSYAQAIDFFNNNVKGTPVICEAHGYSYTDHCVVSAYTGLPTIFGWLTHEWLWRFQGVVDKETGSLIQDPDKPDLWEEIINPRHLAVDTIYTSESPEVIRHYLDLYNVEYIIVGELERVHYGYVNDTLIRSLGEIVFETNDLYVIRISR